MGEGFHRDNSETRELTQSIAVNVNDCIGIVSGVAMTDSDLSEYVVSVCGAVNLQYFSRQDVAPGEDISLTYIDISGIFCCCLLSAIWENIVRRAAEKSAIFGILCYW